MARRDGEAGTIAWIVYETVARALVVGMDGLEDDASGMTQNDRIAMWTAAMACCDGVEGKVRGHLTVDRLLSGMAKESPRLTLAQFEDLANGAGAA